MKESENGQVFDASPYLKLFIDKDGRWFQNGTEIIHPEIYKQFNQMLERLSHGEYTCQNGQRNLPCRSRRRPFRDNPRESG